MHIETVVATPATHFNVANRRKERVRCSEVLDFRGLAARCCEVSSITRPGAEIPDLRKKIAGAVSNPNARRTGAGVGRKSNALRRCYTGSSNPHRRGKFRPVVVEKVIAQGPNALMP